MSKNFVPHYSGLQIDWDDYEEVEFISPEALEGEAAATAAQCRFSRRLVAYNYPVTARREGLTLVLDYRFDAPNWPKNAGWSVTQGKLTILFSATSSSRPVEIAWDRTSDRAHFQLEQGKDWIYQSQLEQSTIPVETRGRVLRQVLDRRGQSLLRAQLFASTAWCEISRTSCNETLEACHILPVENGGVDCVENALLLRRDLHALFDANLLRFHPYRNGWIIAIGSSVKDKIYRALDGIELQGIHLQAKSRFLEARNSLAVIPASDA